MLLNRFIFISPGRSQFFCSDLEEPVEGFRVYKDYRLATGDIDTCSFDIDRHDLLNHGWKEIPSPHYLDIKLYYMKDSGKYYSEGVIKANLAEVNADPAGHWYHLIEDVRRRVDEGDLPGLMKGTKFDTFVLCEDHPNCVPTLVRAR